MVSRRQEACTFQEFSFPYRGIYRMLNHAHHLLNQEYTVLAECLTFVT
jgi:hypothetical protein